MGNVLAVIGEYNPFHNGHLYQLNEAKKAMHSNYAVALISGNFVQRGDASIVDKWTKAKMALLNGFDLVIELPCVYSISSAENFATGAVRLLNSLKIINNLSFGCEADDLNILKEFANILAEQPPKYKSLLSHELSKGIPFPKARENALLMCLNNIRKSANVLSSPNNILAIEYLKALRITESNIHPFGIKRVGADYHSEEIMGDFASATALRKYAYERNFYAINRAMPKISYDILEDCIKKGHYSKGLISYEKEIMFVLRNMTVAEIAKLPDVTEGLENLIKNAANSCNNLNELMGMVKSKRYTQTRIQRILLYALLGITKEDMENSKKIDPYIRVLGFNTKGQNLLSDICNANSKLQVITSVKKFTTTCRNKKLLMMFEKDIKATNIYTLGYEYDSYSNLDYTNKLITF